MTSSPLIKPERQGENPQIDPSKVSRRRRENATETETDAAALEGDLTTAAERDFSSLPGANSRLARLTETAKAYARAARSENTARAYDFGLAAIRLLAPPQRF